MLAAPPHSQVMCNIQVWDATIGTNGARRRPGCVRALVLDFVFRALGRLAHAPRLVHLLEHAEEVRHLAVGVGQRHHAQAVAEHTLLLWPDNGCGGAR